MCANLKLYNDLKHVPPEAKKPIGAGRLKGKTDINPMWRIKMLTQHFGICGIGWKTTVEKMWIENGAGGEQTANVIIHLFIKDPETKTWSDPIVGIGGAAFIASESKGLFTDDDCYKKAYTDAISVACKALGMAADVYYEKDPDSKYASDTGTADIPFQDNTLQSELPFPEVERPITYEEALAYVVTRGNFNGKTLKEVYKTDTRAVTALFNDPFTEKRCKQAILVINAEIQRSRANK